MTDGLVSYARDNCRDEKFVSCCRKRSLKKYDYAHIFSDVNTSNYISDLGDWCCYTGVCKCLLIWQSWGTPIHSMWFMFGSAQLDIVRAQYRQIPHVDDLPRVFSRRYII